MLDFLILFIFVVVSIGFGLHARRKASQNLEEYFLAGKTLPGWQAGISMAATQFAADTPLLVTGIIAQQEFLLCGVSGFMVWLFS